MNEATTENTAWITSISGAWLKWRADMLISKAGFRHVGYAKDGKLCFQLLPREMPQGEVPCGELLLCTNR